MGTKRIAALIFICFVVCLMCGCDMTRDDKIQVATLKYLNSYYNTGDTFSVNKCQIQGGEDGAYEAYVECHSEKFDGNFTVSLDVKNGEADASDNYFTVYMKPEAEAWLNSILQKCGVNATAKYKFTSDVLPNAIKQSALFGEYVESGKCKMYIYVLSKEQIPDKNMNDAVRIIAEKKVSGKVALYTGYDAEKCGNSSVDDIIDRRLVVSDRDYIINNAYDIIAE